MCCISVLWAKKKNDYNNEYKLAQEQEQEQEQEQQEQQQEQEEEEQQQQQQQKVIIGLCSTKFSTSIQIMSQF